MTTPTEDARRRVRTQLDLQLADDHEFVMIERCDAEALIEPPTDDDREKVIRGMDHWAQYANNPAVRVDCAHARDVLRRQVSHPEPVTGAEVEAALESWDPYHRAEIHNQRMRSALEAARAVRLPARAAR